MRFMPTTLYTLQNENWQVGVLPETGGALAFGRVRYDGGWLDVLRPTAPEDYDKVSLCASFPLVPWSNRIRDARFRFQGQEYTLQPGKEGTAPHGVGRYFPWQVTSHDDRHIHMLFDSATHERVNFPFRFSSRQEFHLEGDTVSMVMTLKNEDTRPMPGGIGHHPYFVRALNNPADEVLVQIPCDKRYALTDLMATAAPEDIPPARDFRQARHLGETQADDLFTGRRPGEPARMIYPGHSLTLTLHSDDIFQHMILFAPVGKPFYAVEPVSNANDGFNLYDRGVAESGVFVLEPGEERGGTVRLRAMLDR